MTDYQLKIHVIVKVERENTLRSLLDYKHKCLLFIK